MRSQKHVKRTISVPEPIKKSFNINSDLAQLIDDHISDNPGISFTLIMNQALKNWLQDPKITLKRSKVTEKQVDEFMAKNSDLLDDLSR